MTSEPAYDLIRFGFPRPHVDQPDSPPRQVCPDCSRLRLTSPPTPLVIDRRRINPDSDVWSRRDEGMLVSDRVRAILSTCCPSQVAFAPVIDCTNTDEVLPGFFVAHPLEHLDARAPENAETIPCADCQAPIPIHQSITETRLRWNGADILAGPLLPGPVRHYYASRRLLLLLQRAGVRGTHRYGDPLNLGGDAAAQDTSAEDWADQKSASIPTERTFRPPPPDEDWLEALLAQVGENRTGVHVRALMAWQHNTGIPLPPSFRSLLFACDGLDFELFGWTLTGRVGLSGRVSVAGLAQLGKPSLRLGQWEVSAKDRVDLRWDGLAFATSESGAVWAFDLSRPSNRGEYPVFRYDPEERQPLEFFDHFVDWLQECWPAQTSEG